MIVGIGHESRVGKDTFCMFLMDALRGVRGLKVIREGFADRLYDVCHIIYGWAGFQPRQHYVRVPSDKEVILPLLGKTPRDLLIGIGNAVREYDAEAWLMNVARESTDGWLKIVTDVRKVNELLELKKQGAFLIKMTRGEKSTRETDVDLHGYDLYWNVIIDNNGTRDELKRIATDIAERIIIPNLRNLNDHDK